MTFDEFQSKVTVQIVPEQPEHPDPRGGFTGEQTFWLHTVGMDKFDRPEMEMREVPGLFVTAAGGYLNMWSYHSVERHEIPEDENLMDESGVFPIVFHTTLSKDPFYKERGIKCLRLDAVAVVFTCGNPHHGETVH